MSKGVGNLDGGITTRRLETLVDGIFAIVMTLLVLTIGLPKIPGTLSNPLLLQSLIDLSPKFQSYGLAFILLAIFWKGSHRQFHLIKQVDAGVFIISIIWLMFVALVPFSTSFMGTYGDYQVPVVFFQANLLAIGLLYYLHWHHVVKKNLLDKSIAPTTIAHLKKQALVLPIVSSLAIMVSFVSPEWSNVAYISIPFIHGLILKV